MRFLTRHCVMAAMLMLLPHLVIPLLLVIVCSIAPIAQFDVRVTAILALSTVCPFGVGFALTRARRLAAMRVWPILLVVLASPAQLAVHVLALAVVAGMLPYNQYYGDAIPYMIPNWQMWLAVAPMASAGLPLPSGLVGVALGYVSTRSRREGLTPMVSP